MLHARPDYNRIQDPANRIPLDEPVFLLRGQDICAPATVRVWAALAAAKGSSPDIVEMASQQAARMEEWQAKHGTKVPDVPENDGAQETIERLEGEIAYLRNVLRGGNALRGNVDLLTTVAGLLEKAEGVPIHGENGTYQLTRALRERATMIDAALKDGETRHG